jgi:hypothetical protein
MKVACVLLPNIPLDWLGQGKTKGFCFVQLVCAEVGPSVTERAGFRSLGSSAFLIIEH